MKKSTILQNVIAIIILLSGYTTMAQTTNNESNLLTNKNETEMKMYVIEREIPGAGNFTQEDLKAIAIKSCGVVAAIGPDIKWIHSYVTDNKLYCIYEATSVEVIKKHAEMGGFPCNKVSEVANVFSPATAELQLAD